MGTLPQALEIIFEMQRKKTIEKITRKEINFPTLKTRIFFPPSLDPSYFHTS
jgi:hypothetical protein